MNLILITYNKNLVAESVSQTNEKFWIIFAYNKSRTLTRYLALQQIFY
jgi:hypothetical protein